MHLRSKPIIPMNKTALILAVLAGITVPAVQAKETRPATEKPAVAKCEQALKAARASLASAEANAKNSKK
jgi:Tfp pilus assembly major pilin PilA